MNPFFLLLLCAAIIHAQPGSPVAPLEELRDLTSGKALKGNSTACDKACAVIAGSLPSALYYAKTGNFQLWDTKQSDLTPVCRVEPSSSEEVSFVLKTLIDTKCHFAVKSGGHACSPGSSNADGGVTIDLVRMNEVQVAKDRKSVKIGAGLRWGDVYIALEKEGLMVVGGRVTDIGVGGLTLGGGLSFFVNRYGCACDNVL
ncbi:hypothetical protein GJ744_009041 [Endocarpon pusillum]|uniref:FAD-binding PCMH-type domain-containing protein n=1 Tax=Endocarpon pusillum TaxID=364733 RepID=A0A8H7AIA6_9EURO|nr:hypothetical protein GJ744_009041 [Endocarpon pusillum]